ncbi:probable inactive leucine-rich repeat receptor-like protein kinase At3g03770 isoform X1 [Ricinus communis]|uniref:probable inactive leucine-rich repeat receptor-like protein kinase At3g03770 isoform X1 n=1 Tax=Ricinus communis TaxID=3988 RepID=UPI00201AF598|nr:probable inactive leucine-rich repeat receptor-like protein kinase At3g03770 isoform X1 [Ricinus communis]
MASSVHFPCHLLLFSVSFLSLVHHSCQLPSAQSQSILVIQQLLDYPLSLSSINTTADFCNIEPTPSLTLVCYEDNITQLHITGNNGFPPLPQSFSIDSFFTTLAALSNLKVLSLVSLGLWGPLPATIGQLYSLEILNVSSNHLYGTIPEQLSSLRNLQTLILEHNNFTGHVPSCLSSLPLLAVLSLKNNSFGGSLPKSMTSMENLRVLSVSHNLLSGEVPDIHHLTNLQVVDLQDNYFGPHFPSLHSNLVSLVLRNNSFHFGIPSDLISYYQLQRLDISLNGFVGPFLPSLLSLPSLTYIDISENKFTGMLFENMSCNFNLAHVDLSSNLLSGDLPTCLKSSSKTMVVHFASNCLSNQEQKQHPSNFCQNEALAVKPHDKEMHNKRPHDKAVLASGTIGGIIGAIIIVGLVSLVIGRLYSKFTVEKPQARLIMENVSSVNTVKLLSDARYISQTMKLGANLPPYRTFALEELKEATQNFDNSHLLDHYKIYRGKLRDGTLVAIRSLTVKKKHSQQNITRHIELISKLRHSHLVSALGHCFDCCLDDSSTSRIFLIFEFLPNGTLRDYISGPPGKKLNWKQRIGAGIGVAKGIQFLHTGVVPGVFSNNLKITDVLLDHDLHVKVSSYNLPLLAESRRMVGAPVTSPGPKQCTLTRETDDDKKDVYDLGVIFVEIIVGRPIMFLDEVIVVKDLLQVSITVDDTARRSIIDPAVCKECADDSLKTMMAICIRCLSDKPSDRPSVEDVLWNLQFAAQVQESWEGGSHNNQESYVSCSHV